MNTKSKYNCPACDQPLNVRADYLWCGDNRCGSIPAFKGVFLKDKTEAEAFEFLKKEINLERSVANQTEVIERILG